MSSGTTGEPMPSATATPQQAGTHIVLGPQYIKDLSFESPSAPQIYTATQATPDIGIAVNVQMRGVVDNTFEVALHLKIEANIDKKPAYIAELAYAGIFIIPPTTEENLKLFLLVEAPRMLFPFARAIIANTVREGGFAPLMLNPIDFMAHYNANKNNIGMMKTAGAA